MDDRESFINNALVVLPRAYEALGQAIPPTVASVIPSGQSVLPELRIKSEDLKVDRQNRHRVHYRAVINELTKYQHQAIAIANELNIPLIEVC